MKLAFIASLITSLSLCTLMPHFAHADERKAPPNPGMRTHEECLPHDRACITNRRVKKVEETAEEMSEQYKQIPKWETVTDDAEETSKTKYGTRALKYPLAVPIYIIKFFTWPIALLTNSLVKTGVVHTVVDAISNDERTFWVYPRLEMGFGSGFGGGLGITYFDFLDRNFKITSWYQVHISMNQQAKIEITKPDAFYLGDKPCYFNFTTFINHMNDANFYGVGSDSMQDDRARYGIDTALIGGWIGVEPASNFYIKGHLHFTTHWTEHGSDGPSVETVFPASELVAFEDTLYYADVGFSVEHDTRDREVAPTRGGLRKFMFLRMQGLQTTDFDFNAYQLELLQYIPAFLPRQTLALRMVWTFLQDTGSKGIPFYRLTRLDVYSPLRGFSSGRFRDTDSVLFNIEYRFPVWDYIDGQFFFDTGRVFHGVENFSFDDWKFAGGGGFSFRTDNFFLMRFQLGYGGEGLKILMSMKQAF